jgi:hypothetical protein
VVAQDRDAEEGVELAPLRLEEPSERPADVAETDQPDAGRGFSHAARGLGAVAGRRRGLPIR